MSLPYYPTIPKYFDTAEQRCEEACLATQLSMTTDGAMALILHAPEQSSCEHCLTINFVIGTDRLWNAMVHIRTKSILYGQKNPDLWKTPVVTGTP